MNEQSPQQKSEKKWKWHTRLPEILREALSSPKPETELQALQMILIEIGTVRRQVARLVNQVEEIRDELQRIRNEI